MSGAAIFAACGPVSNAGPAATTVAEPEKEKQEVAAPAAKMYQQEIIPMTSAECGRCHTYHFGKIKDDGGKHQLDCSYCHEQFHAYNPKKNNWDAIMPKCQGCHDLAHGPDFPNCMECHHEPHAPKDIQFTELIKPMTVEGKQGEVQCAVCHKNEGSEFAQYPSLHNTEVNCQGCHAEKHGVIPSCLDCHEPHIPGQVYNDCLVCHGPHSASNIKQYPEDVSNASCSSCHDGVYNALQANVTKHTALQCAACHVSHAQIPLCQDCHGEPHGEGLHKRFASCLECHVDPHDLPVNIKK